MPLFGADIGVQLAASNTTYATDTVVLSGSAGGRKVNVSYNGSTILFSVADFAMSTWGNLAGLQSLTSTNLTASTRSLFVFPLQPGYGIFPADITASTARMLMSVSYGTTATNVAAWTMSMGIGIYVISGSGSAATLSLINSASWSFGSGGTAGSTLLSSSVSGIRWATIHSSQWSSAPYFYEGSVYFGAFFMSTAGPALGSWAIYGASQSTMNISGAIGAGSVSNTTVGLPYYAGVYASTTNAMPASINLNQLNRQAGMANFVPLIEFDMLNASH
jgi:hypothetical protein